MYLTIILTSKNPQYYTNTKIEEIEDSKNRSDYEAIWEIAIDKWTRN